MTPEIKSAMQKGRLVLLLGAGASLSSRTRDGKGLSDGYSLAKMLASEAHLPYQDEPLPVVYSAAKRKVGDGVFQLLESNYKHVRPSDAYCNLSKFPWPRIYTLNIDDAFETALRKNSTQSINVRYRYDRVGDLDPFFESLDYVKLNGSIDRFSDGIIFSPQEYGQASANVPLWYEELGQDFFRFTFLFIGTRLSEPLFYHQIERYRRAANVKEGRSYVLTREATEIEKGSLEDLNLQHITGTIEEFSEWLTREFEAVPTPWDIASAVHPQLKYLTKRDDSHRYVSLFEKIMKVGRRELASELTPPPPRHQIRDFYRGFKPTWRDIIDEVPAELRVLNDVFIKLRDLSKDRNLFIIYGPAGSGKTTVLMQLALKLSEACLQSVYYLTEPVSNFSSVMNALEESNSGRYFIFVDRLSMSADSIYQLLDADKIKKGIIVASERQNVWNSRVQFRLGNWCHDPFHISTIDSADADQILVKLEQFGQWKRLSHMPPRQRRSELLKKAERQLLIGLLEATSGQGFEKIIENDYTSLSDDNERMFVVLVGLGTIHRLPIRESIVSRALPHLKILDTTETLLKRTSGIVSCTDGNLYARHPIYIERLFEVAVTKEEKHSAICAILNAFSVYNKPLLASVGRSSGTVFKWIVNHGFLKNTLSGDMSLVLSIYESFAKAYEDDGLYWLQYGLALRDSGMQEPALEKLRIARDIYPIKQTEHAYAQQLFIIADETTSKARAYAHLNEAKEILERLDRTFEDGESDYPLVTLSEHHTQIVARFEGETAARAMAKEYANLLQKRIKDSAYNARLSQAWKTLALYSTSGVWSEG